MIANLYAAVVVFIYAFGIFPYVHSFWQLALVLAPFVIYCLTLMTQPTLMGFGLPLLVGAIMSLNFQNHYQLDTVFFLDASLATILGPIISVYIIHTVRAMSPDMMVQRILSLHYRALKKAIYLPYNIKFRIHLRGMLDRIGVLNSKPVQSEDLKHHINAAVIEASAAVDLVRLQELIQRHSEQPELQLELRSLQILLEQFFDLKAQYKDASQIYDQLIQQISVLINHTECSETDIDGLRVQMALNNIQSSLCHHKIIEGHQYG